MKFESLREMSVWEQAVGAALRNPNLGSVRSGDVAVRAADAVLEAWRERALPLFATIYPQTGSDKPKESNR
jgi:hypothetical protein